MQASQRSAWGEEATALQQMEDSGCTFSKGDIMCLSVKPPVVGAMLHSNVAQVILFRLLMPDLLWCTCFTPLLVPCHRPAMPSKPLTRWLVSPAGEA